ncbi:MAG: methyl-accepting chemotaxis protein, partial [Alphaproteobacteria bacterium]|nr:methyl-accepting chemotaxis protein [Alphaproteobacteria bacterium]
INGGISYYAEQELTESLRVTYEERVIPAGQLAEISRRMYQNVLNLSMISGGQTKDTPSLVAEIESNAAAISKEWDTYMASSLSSEERALADRYAAARKTFVTEGLKPGVALAKAGNTAELLGLMPTVTELFGVAMAVNAELVALQASNAQATYEKAQRDHWTALAINASIVLLGIIVAIIASKSVQKILNRRISYLDSRLGSIAGGNLSTDIVVGNDELQGILTTVKALQAKLAYGELEKKELDGEKKIMQEKLANDFEQSVKSIVNLVAAAATELSQTASSMVVTVMESSQKTGDASHAAVNTTANVQTVAAAAEELSASVREISSQLQKSTQLVSQSKEKTQNADVAANALTNATDKVVAAMEMIATIAGQINLLALNATIESARAGEAGKGFAVVASEVKNLATQADKTVSDVQVVVEEIRGASQAIISALGDIGVSVGSISEATSSVASAVEEQSAVTNEIAKSMQTAAAGTQTISDNLQEVRASSSHAGSASEQMLMASKELSQQAESLNTQVDNFLSRVRAA